MFTCLEHKVPFEHADFCCPWCEEIAETEGTIDHQSYQIGLEEGRDEARAEGYRDGYQEALDDAAMGRV
jgi:hypothetical protein